MRAVAALALLALMLAAACGQQPARADTTTGAQRTGMASSAASAPAPAAKSARTYVIFADVTKSLTPEEQQSVCDTVREVVARIPAESQLYVFPILEDVPRSHALFDGKLPAAMGTADRAYIEALRANWAGEIESRVKRIDAGPAEGRLHTCISGALRKATEVVTANPPAEVIFVSDMLEDCPDSLIGGAVSLEKKNIEPDLDRARHISADTVLLDLHGANVTALLPTMPVTKAKVLRPPQHQVTDFWRAILDHCHDSKENYYVGTQVPQRLTLLADSDTY